ncbi:MAG: hypothetical protein ACLT16_12580 [[Clostridium] innocuum]
MQTGLTNSQKQTTIKIAAVSDVHPWFLPANTDDIHTIYLITNEQSMQLLKTQLHIPDDLLSMTFQYRLSPMPWKTSSHSCSLSIRQERFSKAISGH